MCMWSEEEHWQDYMAERCNDALCRLSREDEEYDSGVRRRAVLAEKIKDALTGKGDLLLSETERNALYECFAEYYGSDGMAELIACYREGFGDALRIVIETGALPEQK